MRPKALQVLWLCFAVLVLACPAGALEPAEVLVVANRNAADSMPLARFYMQRRRIPQANLVVLRTGTGESCTRREYNLQIAVPLRRFIETFPQKARIRCLVLMSAVPALWKTAGPIVCLSFRKLDGHTASH